MPVEDTKLQLYAVAWLILHITLLILSMVFTSTYITWTDSIGDFEALVAVLMIKFVSCLIVVEAILKRQKQIDLLHQFVRIDGILRHKLHIAIDYKKHWLRSNVFVTAWICACVLFIVCVIAVKERAPQFWLVYALPFFIYSLNYHRMVTYVHMIQLRYQMLNQFIEKVCLFQERGVVNNEILLSIQRVSKVALDESKLEPLLSKSQLIEIRNTYQIMYEATNTINDLFWWSLPICIAIDFLRLLVNVYILFVVLLFEFNWTSLVGCLFWGCINTAHLLFLSHACHSANKQVSFDFASLLDLFFYFLKSIYSFTF